MTFVKTTGFGFVALLALAAVARVDEETPPYKGQAERFQAVRMSDSRVLVIDTSTGQCWSKYLGAGGWRDEGRPSQDQPRPVQRRENPEEVRDEAIEVQARPPRLSLENDLVELTIRQRGRTEIPGSDGTLFIHLGDITEGQVLVALRNEAGQIVVAEQSLAQGESLKFNIEGQSFVAIVKELRNLLTGEDFAVLRFKASTPENEQPTRDAIDEPGDLR